MRARHVATGFSVALCGSLAFGAPSAAHIDLLSPPPRVGGAPDSNLDERPCGQRVNARTADKLSVFRPGESIVVAWDVYVQHPSYFRLAFDLTGDDSFSDRSSLPADRELDQPSQLPPGPGELILGYVEDPDGQRDYVEQRVTLPAQPCSDCTLQLTQFVYDLPLRDATYYQCADIVLEGEPLEPEDAGAPGGAAQPDDELGSAAPPENGCALARAQTSTPAGYLALVLLLGLASLRRLMGPRRPTHKPADPRCTGSTSTLRCRSRQRQRRNHTWSTVRAGCHYKRSPPAARA
jgi:hypothetical protein